MRDWRFGGSFANAAVASLAKALPWSVRPTNTGTFELGSPGAASQVTVPYFGPARVSAVSRENRTTESTFLLSSATAFAILMVWIAAVPTPTLTGTTITKNAEMMIPIATPGLLNHRRAVSTFTNGSNRYASISASRIGTVTRLTRYPM